MHLPAVEWQEAYVLVMFAEDETIFIVTRDKVVEKGTL